MPEPEAKPNCGELAEHHIAPRAAATITPTIEVDESSIEVRVGGVTARLLREEIRFAHLRCRPLEFPQEEIPEHLAAAWDVRYARRKATTGLGEKGG